MPNRETKPKKPTSIDEYLSAVRDDQRPVLEKLRNTIRSAAPGAEECISYGLAAFRLNGRMLVGLGATPKHCAFYLMSSSALTPFEEDVADFETSTGTIKFSPEKPLPTSLVRKLVKARIAENAALDSPEKPEKKKSRRTTS